MKHCPIVVSGGLRKKTKLIEEFIRNGEYDKIPPCTISVDLEHDPKNYPREKIFSMCPDVYEEDGVKKLAHHLYPKENYVVHHKILKKYLREGMIVKKVNKILFYRERAWMREYIEFCVEQRTIATENGNKFLKEFFKLMCNSVFGKSMENVRNRVNFKLVNNHEQLQKYLNKPTLLDTTNYHPDLLVGVHFKKSVIKLDKPIYTGQAILDLSKLMMYEFLYDYVLPKWGVDNVRVVMTDTDSLLLEIKTDDLPKDILPDIRTRFDTGSNVGLQFGETIFPKVNLKKLGMMSDECEGDVITEAVGIGPKNYAINVLETQKDGSIELKDKVKCKGVGKAFVPRIEEYKKIVFGEEETISKECFRINSKDHNVFSISTNTVALRNKVVKRVADPDEKYETLPFIPADFLQ